MPLIASSSDVPPPSDRTPGVLEHWLSGSVLTLSFSVLPPSSTSLLPDIGLGEMGSNDDDVPITMWNLLLDALILIVVEGEWLRSESEPTETEAGFRMSELPAEAGRCGSCRASSSVLEI